MASNEQAAGVADIRLATEAQEVQHDEQEQQAAQDHRQLQLQPQQGQSLTPLLQKPTGSGGGGSGGGGTAAAAAADAGDAPTETTSSSSNGITSNAADSIHGEAPSHEASAVVTVPVPGQEDAASLQNLLDWVNEVMEVSDFHAETHGCRFWGPSGLLTKR